ncbi:MAG: PEP-CTERM sorting domain-containing protein [Nostoc sp.]
MTKNNRKKAVAQAISTAVALGWAIMQVESAQAATLAVNNLNNSDNTTNVGDLTISTPTLIILNSTSGNSGEINAALGGNITLRADDLLILKPVPKPSAIAGGNINSGAGGNITITSDTIFLTTVPEPSAIAGSILAGSLAWLAKRKQTAFRKAKV